MARVFVNFRNGDEPYAAALIHRALGQRFGIDALFRSTDSIPPGARYAEEIWRHHEECAVLIAVIGPRWLRIADADGRPRLRRPDDWVHDEIARALAAGKVVIPVLLDGVPRMARADLPDDLAELAELQSVRLSPRHLDETLSVLAAAVARVIGDPPVVAAAPAAPPRLTDRARSIRPRGPNIRSGRRARSTPVGSGAPIRRYAPSSLTSSAR